MGYHCGPVVRDYNNFNNNRRNVNVNQRLDNGYGMTPNLHSIGYSLDVIMKTYRNLYQRLCSYENLEFAFRKARKRKTLKDYVVKFESDLKNNLQNLKYELESFTYLPQPMINFIVRDPKTRKISASHFRDRVVYHAICNIIAPTFEEQFIHDSFANQINKGTHSAIKRAEKFMRKVMPSENDVLGGGPATFEKEKTYRLRT